MGAVPKRRLSTGRQGRREAGKKLTISGSQLRRTTKKQRKQLKQNNQKLHDLDQLQAASKVA